MTHFTAGAETGQTKRTANRAHDLSRRHPIPIDAGTVMNIVVPFDLALGVFLLGTFAAAFVTGVAGFAFGMVAAGIWLHALAPTQAATLIVAYALLVQGHATWKLRRTINLPRLLPFVIGSAAGIPVGLAILEWVPAARLRTGVGVLLILFGVYNLARPKVPDMKQAGRVADAGIGLLNGLLGGSTGLGGILPTIWCVLRGWPRDEHRAVSQPTAAATFLMSILTFGGAGFVTPGTAQLFLIGLPVLVAGTMLGWAFYGKLNEASFRRVVLCLILVSGVMLLATGR
jgi:uncharacterized membrane protein YfcA